MQANQTNRIQLPTLLFLGLIFSPVGLVVCKEILALTPFGGERSALLYFVLYVLVFYAFFFQYPGQHRIVEFTDKLSRLSSAFFNRLDGWKEENGKKPEVKITPYRLTLLFLISASLLAVLSWRCADDRLAIIFGLDRFSTMDLATGVIIHEFESQPLAATVYIRVLDQDAGPYHKIAPVGGFEGYLIRVEYNNLENIQRAEDFNEMLSRDWSKFVFSGTNDTTKGKFEVVKSSPEGDGALLFGTLSMIAFGFVGSILMPLMTALLSLLIITTRGRPSESFFQALGAVGVSLAPMLIFTLHLG